MPGTIQHELVNCSAADVWLFSRFRIIEGRGREAEGEATLVASDRTGVDRAPARRRDPNAFRGRRRPASAADYARLRPFEHLLQGSWGAECEQGPIPLRLSYTYEDKNPYPADLAPGMRIFRGPVTSNTLQRDCYVLNGTP
jgi:hypothetical protein